MSNRAYPSISFNVAGATEASYRDFIGELREIVSRGTRTVDGLPVLNPESKVLVGNRFVLVRLINGDTVTLAIDVVNLYVVAFSGANNKSYFFKDATTLQLKNLFVDTKQTKLSYTSNYDILEKQSKKRDQLPLGPTPLADAITRLWNGRSVAEPLLVVIQMVSEVARFKRIEEQVRKSITGRNTFTPKGLIVSMENEWSPMSKQVQLSKDGEHFIKSVQLQDDNYKPLIVNDFTTLSRYTMVAILLDKSSRSNIALAEDFVNDELFNSEIAVTT
ncbi:nigrin b-like [Camellia sinensis]|uniref:nigrin b-like n=1 Tax=Camellia sinensis TaxID=4442 RepID=UPI001035CD2E|nr:nigrin b-like [Camellia sinensis]XP_028080439.1 nigrin b-like [Camellia sinensis]XP_028080440.1 nigrin b-like [Camellia sinensis]XP_028080441.1 nigrin b-like [Camellia sinensis]XP_028080442.1 nigrin b-like [Camellia sinensis]XP_028080443.1 nigrin b-like [Camellia sinensis]XP_028080444.1 nigrin b-like [Camellia sinensis]XP_028080445.1 nigrin b-like [Camellia sinensis]